MKYQVVHGVRRPGRLNGPQYARRYDFEGLRAADDALVVPLDGRKPDSVRGVIKNAFNRLKKNHPGRIDYEIETHHLADRDAIGVWRVFPDGGNGNGGGKNDAEKPAVGPSKPPIVKPVAAQMHINHGGTVRRWLNRKLTSYRYPSLLAQAVGVDNRTMTEWLNNETPIPDDKLRLIAAKLGAPSFEAFMAADQ